MRRSRLLPLLLVGLLVMPLAADAQSLGEVRAERDRIQQRLDAAASELAELESRQATLEEEQRDLGERLDRLSVTVAEADSRVRLRVRELYKGGSADPIVVLLSGGEPQEAVERAVLIQRLVEGDRRDAERADSARVQVRALAARLAETEEELAAAAQAERDRSEQLQADLERARKLEQRLEAEERERRAEEARRAAAAAEAARRRAAARPAPTTSGSSGGGSTSGGSSSGDSTSGGSSGGSVSSGGMACPVGRPHSFTDTWGAPRSGGRRHQGTDILAPRGQTVLAIVSGTWDVRPYGASAGNWGMLRGNDGNVYYYMHLERHVVGDGARVSAGQQVATNGDTGNARGTPHVHFELHPGGGGAINPYPTLRRVCG